MSEFEEKVLELLKKIDEKLDNIIGAGSKAAQSSPKPAAKPAETASTPKPSAVAEKQTEEAKVEEEPAAEGRRVCPGCGSTEFNHIEDKSKILHSMGGIKIYAKNYQCKKCGKIL
ncbi:MAG: hypothetical protein ACFFAH_16745 [Promethearchaeota archaeon]